MKLFKLLLAITMLSYCIYFPIDLTAQVTSNVISRVLQINVGSTMGTAFTMDIDGRQYLITAKHLVNNLKSVDTININQNNQWKTLPVKIFKCKDLIDIAVLIPPKPLTISYPLTPLCETKDTILALGQETFFAGFPYGISSNTYYGNQDTYYPIALFKKGNVMSLNKDGDVSFLLLDGFNNPGFSGGPIVFRDIRKPNDLTYYLAGVISGFRPEILNVLKPVESSDEATSKAEQWRIITLPNEHKAILQDTDQFFVRSNTGIVIGYDIRHAVELIKKNPIGPKVVQ